MDSKFDFEKMNFELGGDPKENIKLLNTIFESFDQISEINYMKFCPKKNEDDLEVNIVLIADSYDFINIRYKDKKVYDEKTGKMVYKVEIARYKPLGDKDGAIMKNYSISVLDREYIEDNA